MAENTKTKPQIKLGGQAGILGTKVDLLLTELKEQREDIRRLKERQDTVQEKNTKEMQKMNQQFNAKLDANYRDFTKSLHSNFVQTMIGVGAIMAAIGSLIVAALK